MAETYGEIIQVIGPVVDVSFELTGSSLPNIHDAMEITRDNGEKLVVECQQHIGENTIRAIAMDSTDGSAIQGNLGVNPSLTITAQAEYAMSLIPSK